jgi:hypothetical protein
MIRDRPAIDDLQPWSLRTFEQAYKQRSREQASRDDMALAFVQALRWAHVHACLPRPQFAGCAMMPYTSWMRRSRKLGLGPRPIRRRRFTNCGCWVRMAAERNRHARQVCSALVGDCGRGRGPPVSW